jgi:hypothetical protein
MARGELSKPFNLISTPATIYTREVGFSVKVNVSAEWPAKLPIYGTPYRNCQFVSKVRQKEFGDFILTRIDGSGDHFYFYFSKNKSAAEAYTPFKDPEISMGNHYWPPILIKVDIEKSKVPRAVNTGDSIYRGNTFNAIPTFVPSADTGSLFLLREFLMPNLPEFRQHPTPIAGSVSFPVPGGSPFSFPECLHGDITINGMDESKDVYATVGATVSSNVGFSGPYHFPATNFKTWLPYFLYERPTKLATGAYHVAQMEVIPPNLPKAQRGR